MEFRFGLNEKASFYLNIALLGAVFSIFSLVGDSRFTIFGALTLLYGGVGHAVDTFFHNIFGEKANVVITIVELIILIAWVIFSIRFITSV